MTYEDWYRENAPMRELIAETKAVSAEWKVTVRGWVGPAWTPPNYPMCTLCGLYVCEREPLPSYLVPWGYERPYMDKCYSCAQAVDRPEVWRYAYKRESKLCRQRWWVRLLGWLAKL